MSSQDYGEWMNERVVAQRAVKQLVQNARWQERSLAAIRSGYLAPARVDALSKHWFQVTAWFVAVPAAIGGFGLDWHDPAGAVFLVGLTAGVLVSTIAPFVLALQRIIRSEMRWRHLISLKCFLAGSSVGLLAPSTIFLSGFAVANFFDAGATKSTQVLHTYVFLLVLSFLAQFISVPVGGILGLAIGQAIRWLRSNDRRLPPHLGVTRPNH
jgi:hypothetical protein